MRAMRTVTRTTRGRPVPPAVHASNAVAADATHHAMTRKNAAAEMRAGRCTGAGKVVLQRRLQSGLPTSGLRHDVLQSGSRESDHPVNCTRGSPRHARLAERRRHPRLWSPQSSSDHVPVPRSSDRRSQQRGTTSVHIRAPNLLTTTHPRPLLPPARHCSELRRLRGSFCCCPSRSRPDQDMRRGVRRVMRGVGVRGGVKTCRRCGHGHRGTGIVPRLRPFF